MILLLFYDSIHNEHVLDLFMKRRESESNALYDTWNAGGIWLYFDIRKSRK